MKKIVLANENTKVKNMKNDLTVHILTYSKLKNVTLIRLPLDYLVKLSIFYFQLTGERCEYDDPRLLMIIENANLQSRLVLPKANSILTLFPWLRFLPFGYGKTIKHCEYLSRKLKGIIYDTIKVGYWYYITL